MLRGDPLDPRNEAWANKVVALERVGRFGTDSCSPTGLGGFTGCTQALLAGARAERRAADKTDWQAMIADERAKRLAGIDAAADEVEAAVVAEERALAELQKRSEEHTSELQSLMRISYAVFCLKQKIHRVRNYQKTHRTTTSDKII